MSPDLVILAARNVPPAAALSGGTIGLSLGGAALLLGIAAALHHKHRSPRLIGWLTFIVGIPLAGLFAAQLGTLANVSLWSIPVTTVITGYITVVFLHDGLPRRSRSAGTALAVRGGAGGGGSGGRGGSPHRWLQPLYGLVLPMLLLTLGGAVGNGAQHVMTTISHGVGGAVHGTTGK